MKRCTATCLSMILALLLGCRSAVETAPALRVAVFCGHGSVPGCVEDTVEALRLDPGLEPVVVTAREILTGVLPDFDALVLPGGGGSRQMNSLGALAAARVISFVRSEGKGVVGICAGAYMLTDTPNYLCLRLCGVEAVDREHDERGHGIIGFTLTAAGRTIFPELKNRRTSHVYYYEGPICMPVGQHPAPYLELATIQSDVHLQNNAPANLTPGKPLYLAAEAGRGRVFLSVGHPETTPGMRWMVPRMVRWVTRKAFVPYPSSVVRPHLYTHEILFDELLRARERAFFHDLLYAKSQTRIAAIQELEKIRSWSAREWIVGLLRDSNPAVRHQAALALTALEYTAAIDDLRATLAVEPDAQIRAQLTACLAQLRAMVEH